MLRAAVSVSATPKPENHFRTEEPPHMQPENFKVSLIWQKPAQCKMLVYEYRLILFGT
jgi:hypothetical protein